MRADEKEKQQAQIAELVHGGPVSETLERARRERNARIRAELRPLTALAAERRMAENKRQMEEKGEPKKRKLKLLPAWEEK